jgi:hypothetical protein
MADAYFSPHGRRDVLDAVASEHCCRAGGVMVVSCTQHRARAARVAATRLHRETRRLLLLDDTTRASDPNAWAYVGISSRREGARLAWESRVRNAVCPPPTHAHLHCHTLLWFAAAAWPADAWKRPFGMPVASARRQTWAASPAYRTLSLRRLFSKATHAGARRCLRLEK